MIDPPIITGENIPPDVMKKYFLVFIFLIYIDVTIKKSVTPGKLYMKSYPHKRLLTPE
jgi:hypothetical protein